jgi:hypothetical protein
MIGSAQGVFVGRQREMGELKAALEEAEAAAKTALASPPVTQAIESRARAGPGLVEVLRLIAAGMSNLGFPRN